MPRTITLDDNQCAIVITHANTGKPGHGLVQAYSGKAGTLESIEVISRNPFSPLGYRAKTKQRYERPIYYDSNTTSMIGAIKQASKTIADWWRVSCRNDWMKEALKEDDNVQS